MVQNETEGKIEGFKWSSYLFVTQAGNLVHILLLDHEGS